MKACIIEFQSNYLLTLFVMLCYISVGSTNPAISCDLAQKQSDGHWLCLLCLGRIASRQRKRPYTHTKEENDTETKIRGYAHLKCIQRQRRVNPDFKVGLRAGPSSFDTHGYVRIHGSEESRRLAWEVMQIQRRANKNSNLITGKVRQFDLSKQSDLEPLLVRLSTLVRETATRVGIRSDKLHVVDPKLLVAPPQLGKQAVHWDAPRCIESSSIYSFILYCSNGCNSTALPTFPLNKILSFSNDPTEMASVAHLLDSHHYESLPVLPGDIVFFRQSIPHFGVKNICTQGDRVVFFSILSQSNASMQDALQVFPWLYIGAAFGWESREFAQALVDNKDFRPVQQIHGDEGAVAKDVCVSTLKRWSLFDAYNSP